MMRIDRNSKGFTLIELLIVVAIIGILAAIAIPAYSGYTKKAKIAGVVHSLGAVKNAIAAYYVEAFAAPAAADAATIQTTYGVDVPTNMASFAVTAGGTITATVTGVDCTEAAGNGTIILTPNWATKVWTWSGSCDPTYIPKSN